MALQREADLIFLYIVDPSFAGAMDEAMAVTLSDELQRLGKCLLQIAEGRAIVHGVTAQLALREGELQPTIEAFIREVGASALVIGSPQSGPEPQAFDEGRLRAFVQGIEQATGTEVVVVE
jgi:nucleotide-binding universal stress UspA family protein